MSCSNISNLKRRKYFNIFQIVKCVKNLCVYQQLIYEESIFKLLSFNSNSPPRDVKDSNRPSVFIL
jgi:hypothetical protein